MLRAEELRIGNKVNFLDKIVTIEALFKDFVSVSGYERNNLTQISPNHNGIVPISLTKGILLKCGFEYSEALFLYRLKESNLIYEYCEEEDECNYFIHFYHDGTNIIIESSNEHGEMSNMKFSHIKYLHQLQNLYFALAGEELEVKL